MLVNLKNNHPKPTSTPLPGSCLHQDMGEGRSRRPVVRVGVGGNRCPLVLIALIISAEPANFPGKIKKSHIFFECILNIILLLFSCSPAKRDGCLP